SEPLVIPYPSLVHNGALSALVPMGMGIFIGRRSMSGPAGMAQPELPIERFGGQSAGQAIVNSSFAFLGDKLMVSNDGKSGAIITPIFQPAQSFEDNGSRLFFSYISDDPEIGRASCRERV